MAVPAHRIRHSREEYLALEECEPIAPPVSVNKLYDAAASAS